MLQENGIRVDTAAIVSTVLEGILYGISIMMFIWTVWALTYRRTQTGVNRHSGMVIVACLMLLFSTAHMIIDIIRTYEGLIRYRTTFRPDGPVGFFSDVAQWSFVYKNVMYTLQTLVGDGVVIYRCYVVWQSWWIIISPIVLWASVVVTGIGCVYFDSRATVHRENIFAPTTGPWITAFLAATLITNIISTSLLAFRIWKVGRRVAGLSLHATILRPILRIILDAGILYSISLLAALLCFVAKNRGHYVLIDMIMPIISITFYMVIIRITLSKSASQGVSQLYSTSSGRLTLPRMSRSIRECNHQMRRMEVHITQFTETDEQGYGSGRNDPKKDEEAEGSLGSEKTALGGLAV